MYKQCDECIKAVLKRSGGGSVKRSAFISADTGDADPPRGQISVRQRSARALLLPHELRSATRDDFGLASAASATMATYLNAVEHH